jgi:hypothetical protein
VLFKKNTKEEFTQHKLTADVVKYKKRENWNVKIAEQEEEDESVCRNVIIVEDNP